MTGDSPDYPLSHRTGYLAIFDWCQSMLKDWCSFWVSLILHGNQKEATVFLSYSVSMWNSPPSTSTMALQMIGGNIAQTLSKEKIGQAFTRLGFEYRRTSAQRGYIAVHRNGVEMETYRRKLAEAGKATMTDDGMTADS